MSAHDSIIDQLPAEGEKVDISGYQVTAEEAALDVSQVTAAGSG